jgi:nitronate monooxygenase
MEWKTKVTELLGCKYPILQGAYGSIGTWQFASCVAEAGAYGTITASVSGTAEKLREDIRNCKKATGGKFGVNLSLTLFKNVEEMLEVCIEERVPIETSVYKPDAVADRIKKSGLPWIHKAARVKDAIHAQEVGVDAIILVGLEGAGIKNPEQLPTLTTIVWGKKQLKVPVIAAGGIGDAHGFLAALGMGAEGVMMGTAFLATKESPLSDDAKQAILKTGPDNPLLRQRVMMQQVAQSAPAKPAAPGARDWSQAVSFAAGMIDSIPTVKELVEGIMTDAKTILNSWQFLKH